jgi:hypothetical protein
LPLHFFQAWFEEFPAPEPPWDEPTDSEHESDSDSEQTDNENCPTSKHKHGNTKSKTNKRASRFYIYIVCSLMIFVSACYWSYFNTAGQGAEEERSCYQEDANGQCTVN